MIYHQHTEEERRKSQTDERGKKSRGIYPGQRLSACGGRGGGGGGLQPWLGFFFLGRKLMNYILYLTDGCVTWDRAWPGSDRHTARDRQTDRHVRGEEAEVERRGMQKKHRWW